MEPLHRLPELLAPHRSSMQACICSALVKTGWKRGVTVLCASPAIEALSKECLIDMIKDLADRMRPAGKDEPLRLVKELAGLLYFGTPRSWGFPEPQAWVAIGFSPSPMLPHWLGERLSNTLYSESKP